MMTEYKPAKNLSSPRVALVIQYLGTNYHGWQRQPQSTSIQAAIEDAISSVIESKVTIHGAGRTDAGVHAAAQVAHFNYSGPIPASKWAKIINSRLPDDILIRSSAAVADDWHACFSALWRRYRYTIYTDKVANLFLNQVSWHYYHAPLDELLIQQALETLLGKNDLTAFRRTGSARKHSWVNIQEVKCHRQDGVLQLEIQADGFLYGMVRLLVGMLVEVGTHKRSLVDFIEIWQNKRRKEVKYSAPAKGLCLLRVGYDQFPFPPSLWFDTQPRYVLAQ